MKKRRWNELNLEERILISIEEWKIKEMIFKKMNEYTRLLGYKCNTTTIILYMTWTNIYMDIYIYIYWDHVYGQTCTLWMEEHWAGQDRTCIDFQEKYFSMNGFMSCITDCFIQRERGRSYKGQNEATSHRKTHTHLQRWEQETSNQNGLSLLRTLDIFKHQEWNIRILIPKWTIYGLMVSLTV